jgi:hypothetical protein
MTKDSLLHELEAVRANQARDAEDSARTRAADAEAARVKLEQELARVEQEKRQLTEEVETEREAKDRGALLTLLLREAWMELTYGHLRFSSRPDCGEEQRKPPDAAGKPEGGHRQREGRQSATAPRRSHLQVSHLLVSSILVSD